ncbi:MAG: alkaline phosphatase family protein [Coriobacteriia bacterium]
MSGRPVAWFSWVMFALGVVACLGIAYGAYTLANYSWAQVADYKSPYVSSSVPAALRSQTPPASAALSRRVVLIIVDGMRDDISRSAMPTLNTLRTYGTDVSLAAPQPSLSHPNWTTILTGASQTISGVTTNGNVSRVAAPTIMDVARAAGRRVAVVGPSEFGVLYGVTASPAVSLRPWPKGGYLSGTLVDDALRISRATDPQLLVVHLPDLDEAGHAYGGTSAQYREVAGKIDAEIARLVAGLQADSTTFVIVADHGHTASGGHGGWESEVVSVPGIFSGGSIALGKATGSLDQVAPTIAVLAGLRMPAYAESTALRSVISTSAERVFASEQAHHVAFAAHYSSVVLGGDVGPEMLARGAAEHGGPDGYAAYVRGARLALERQARLPISLIIVGAVVLVIALIGVVSWRALVAALAGTAAYYAIYEGLFFGLHRYRWSLSVFNTEEQVGSFMNGRLLEAAISALVAVAVAAVVYPYLRRVGWGSRYRRYLPGWLALAPATLLVVLGTLAVQAAWFLWWWGATITWVLPDFKWAVKYDFDLVQMTAVGAAVVLAPIVTYLIGRYHPKVRAGRVAE